jgi:hypothetical protein
MTDEPITAALNQLTDTAIGIEELAARTGETGGIDALADLAGAIHDAKHVIQFMLDKVLAEILAMDWVEGPDRPTRIPSGGELVKRTTAKREQFDQELVAGAFKSRLTESLCTGDSDTTPVGVLTASGERVPLITVVGPVVDEAFRFAGAGTPKFTNWRSGVAKSLGINLSDYSEWSDGVAYISIEKRSPVAQAAREMA